MNKKNTPVLIVVLMATAWIRAYNAGDDLYHILAQMIGTGAGALVVVLVGWGVMAMWRALFTRREVPPPHPRIEPTITAAADGRPASDRRNRQQ
jgi:hypothetical protein